MWHVPQTPLRHPHSGAEIPVLSCALLTVGETAASDLSFLLLYHKDLQLVSILKNSYIRGKKKEKKKIYSYISFNSRGKH